ncbi:ead/Ea22-like family protein [Pseudomonas aeruginosa]|uniref:ead/Ea22-like family protein n=1 Tax=Pseudomonas aeruginosa TaxID=287 RepID=UPI001C66D4AA|nr:ead/Ea22-like family protein [Pseudomonas aeruginosa]MBW6161987.1 ead/Ea22-like family protein [Pseudomonas aeruginosa]
MDTNKLKELAERATPGPWSCNRHWAIVGGPVLEFTNGAAQQQIAMACGQSWMHDEELRNNAEWIAAANPAAVLELIAEVERLEAELSQCASALPSTYYMDPPDGGNVSIPEQIRRMAKDAARYRWLIASAWYVGPEPKGDTEAVSWHDHNDTMHGVTTAIDAAIEGAKQ